MHVSSPENKFPGYMNQVPLRGLIYLLTKVTSSHAHPCLKLAIVIAIFLHLRLNGNVIPGDFQTKEIFAVGHMNHG